MVGVDEGIYLESRLDDSSEYGVVKEVTGVLQKIELSSIGFYWLAPQPMRDANEEWDHA